MLPLTTVPCDCLPQPCDCLPQPCDRLPQPCDRLVWQILAMPGRRISGDFSFALVLTIGVCRPSAQIWPHLHLQRKLLSRWSRRSSPTSRFSRTTSFVVTSKAPQDFPTQLLAPRSW